MIRKCQANDLEKLLSIWLKGSLQAHGFVSSDYWNQMLPVIKKYYLPNTETFVFEDKRQIKAFISLIDEHYIGALFVDPAFQNKKIGTKLVNYVKKIYPELILKVFAKNVGAIRFYQRNGFKVMSEQVEETTQEPELLMSWSMECKSGYAKKHPEDS